MPDTSRIALISTPWPLFNRPSIQLGTLKAFIRDRLPHVQVDAHHFYLRVAAAIGYDLYRQISEKTWLSEVPYATLCYPEKEKTATRFWHRQSTGLSLCRELNFNEFSKELRSLSEVMIDETDWKDYQLLGLTICLGQLTSSLFFIHQIKQQAPSLKVVVGGSACAGNLGQSLLSAFPEIDFVVSGEGELPLVHLVKGLSSLEAGGKIDPFPGLLYRNKSAGMGKDETRQLPDMDQLPIPDFSDYFILVRSLGPRKAFMPKLPMEISRGCWWRKNRAGRKYSGCAFCNLNLQWRGYRAKTGDRIIYELDKLTERYRVLSVSFMDNLLPADNLKGLFKRAGSLGKDFRLFSEIRATTSERELAAMGSAGMREIQVGIEALSSSLLKKLNKGTSAIINLEIMKNCEAHGMPDLTGNLILEFPGSNKADVDETLASLEFALPFRPLKGIPFWLGYGSHVSLNPSAYGLKRIHNHPFYSHLFPPAILKQLVLIIQGYQGGKRYQHRLWLPVKERINEWKDSYFRLHQAPGSEPILSYQDGGGFMLIRERRYGADHMTHHLEGTSRKIYLFCRKNRSMARILASFPGFGEEKVRPFLKMMVDKRLMFEEGDRYLSLAVPIRSKTV